MKRGSWTILIALAGFLLALAVFLFGQGILQKSEREPEDRQIFCGIELSALPIPNSLAREFKAISWSNKVYIYNVLIRNDSRIACMNPVITIRLTGTILGHVVNETNEDKGQIELSMGIKERGPVTLKLHRLGPESFIDMTIWSDWITVLDEGIVGLSSDAKFKLTTKFFTYLDNRKRFD